MERFNESLIDLQDRLSGMGDHFRCDMVKLVTDRLYGMSLPTGMQYPFKKHKEVVCQGTDMKVQGVGLKV